MKLGRGPFPCYSFDSTKVARPIRRPILPKSWSNLEQFGAVGMKMGNQLQCAAEMLDALCRDWTDQERLYPGGVIVSSARQAI